MTGPSSEPPTARVATDEATLRSLAAVRASTRDLSHQLLTHLPDLGDRATQRALDAWVEQAADTLRALSEAMEDRLLEVGRAAAPQALGSPGPDLTAVHATGDPDRAGDGAW